MKNAALAALAALAAVSVHAETVWVGNAFVTAATAACGPATAGAFAAVGDFYRVIYRPAGVPLGNAADSYFAIIGQRSNFTMLVPNNTFRSGINYASRYVTSQVNFGTNGASILAWSMTPAALDASVKNASLTFTFANFFAVAGCNPTIRADLEIAQ